MSHLNAISAYSDGSLKALTTWNVNVISMCFCRESLTQMLEASILSLCTAYNYYRKKKNKSLCKCCTSAIFPPWVKGEFVRRLSPRAVNVSDFILSAELVYWLSAITFIVREANPSLTFLAVMVISQHVTWVPTDNVTFEHEIYKYMAYFNKKNNRLSQNYRCFFPNMIPLVIDFVFKKGILKENSRDLVYVFLFQSISFACYYKPDSIKLVLHFRANAVGTKGWCWPFVVWMKGWPTCTYIRGEANPLIQWGIRFLRYQHTHSLIDTLGRVANRLITIIFTRCFFYSQETKFAFLNKWVYICNECKTDAAVTVASTDHGANWQRDSLSNFCS